MLQQIISGGQTGADFGGIAAATVFGISTGGYAPRGWKTEDGNNKQLEAMGLKQTASDHYKIRTGLNAFHSDATIIFATNPRSGGTRLTVKFCKKFDKPYVITNPFNQAQSVNDCVTFISLRDYISILNVAGNRESKSPGIEDATLRVLSETFENLL